MRGILAPFACAAAIALAFFMAAIATDTPVIGDPWHEGILGGAAVIEYSSDRRAEVLRHADQAAAAAFAADGPDGREASLSARLLADTASALERIIPFLQRMAQTEHDRFPTKRATTTVFWAGEAADRDNGFIANDQSAWDSNWSEHYGGIDDPNDRCGFLPCSFTPRENPFYVALPYSEFDEDGGIKASARNVPWFKDRAGEASVLKNAWVEVSYRGTACYGQWEDVGPFETDDFEYVFGAGVPTNTFGARAGIDVSPAMRDCLGLQGNDVVEWRFVDWRDVPDGPWKKTVTTRGASWD